MGACASCLGLGRHTPSHEQQESDPLLDDEQVNQYGATISDDLSPIQDEEDDRRERQALEQITARASDNMIDVVHAEHIEAAEHLTPNVSYLSLRGLQRRSEQPEHSTTSVEDDEQAWLRDVSTNEADQDFTVKGSFGANLVMDLSVLREDNQSSARREL